MKKRYRKHIERMARRSPIVAFSQENKFEKNMVLNKEEIDLFSKQMSLDPTQTYSSNYKEIKEDMYSNLLLFVDNYFLCGNHQYVYLLVPIKPGKYQIVEKENIDQWREAYWKKEDPHNKRDWCYYDEDINDLFDYILEKFEKNKR